MRWNGWPNQEAKYADCVDESDESDMDTREKSSVYSQLIPVAGSVASLYT